jgi:hypothetical protein
MYRDGRSIPPYVWVVNDHTEQVTVIISKLRPKRRLTGASIDASATGGGLSFISEVRSSIGLDT